MQQAQELKKMQLQLPTLLAQRIVLRMYSIPPADAGIAGLLFPGRD